MEIFLKRFLETTTKRSPSKISLSREKKTFINPLKPPPPKKKKKKKKRTIERTMLAKGYEWKTGF